MFDGWVLANDSNQISDYSNTFSGCAANIGPWDNDQAVDGADIVLWVRAAGLHQGEAGGLAMDCSMVGPTIKVVPAGPPPGAQFHTLAPCRIVDTRIDSGEYGQPALEPGGTRSFVIPGQCGVPVTAKSIAVNLTVTEPTSGGHLTLFPAGGGVPLASNLNFSAGQTRANSAVLPLGSGGAISVNSVFASGSAHFILDITGYFE